MVIARVNRWENCKLLLCEWFQRCHSTLASTTKTIEYGCTHNSLLSLGWTLLQLFCGRSAASASVAATKWWGTKTWRMLGEVITPLCVQHPYWWCCWCCCCWWSAECLTSIKWLINWWWWIRRVWITAISSDGTLVTERCKAWWTRRNSTVDNTLVSDLRMAAQPLHGPSIFQLLLLAMFSVCQIVRAACWAFNGHAGCWSSMLLLSAVTIVVWCRWRGATIFSLTLQAIHIVDNTLENKFHINIRGKFDVSIKEKILTFRQRTLKKLSNMFWHDGILNELLTNRIRMLAISQLNDSQRYIFCCLKINYSIKAKTSIYYIIMRENEAIFAADKRFSRVYF